MALRFGFRIRYIRQNLPADFNSKEYHGSEDHFRPSTRRDHFHFDTENYDFEGISYNNNQKFFWQPDPHGRQVRPITIWDRDYQHLPIHSSTSLFWCSDSASYMVVEVDCTERDIEPYPDQLDRETERGNEPHHTGRYWRRLSFAHNDTIPNCSKAGYCLGDMRLRAPVPGHWVNVLVPPTQNPQNDTYPPGQRCQLIGSLGILLGMCAFTSNIGNTLQTVQDTFRPQNSRDFQPPQNLRFFHERNKDLGVVVDIYKDPENPDPDYLSKWESGYMGPILI